MSTLIWSNSQCFNQCFWSAPIDGTTLDLHTKSNDWSINWLVNQWTEQATFLNWLLLLVSTDWRDSDLKESIEKKIINHAHRQTTGIDQWDKPLITVQYLELGEEQRNYTKMFMLLLLLLFTNVPLVTRVMVIGDIEALL